MLSEFITEQECLQLSGGTNLKDDEAQVLHARHGYFIVKSTRFGLPLSLAF